MEIMFKERIGGRTDIQTGKVAKQASGSAMVRWDRHRAGLVVFRPGGKTGLSAAAGGVPGKIYAAGASWAIISLRDQASSEKETLTSR
jgi:polyribonucleotide nucleotidyltransferase